MSSDTEILPIHDSEIEQTLENARAADAVRVREILAKARELHGLDMSEVAALMSLSDPELLGELFETARDVARTVAVPVAAPGGEVFHGSWLVEGGARQGARGILELRSETAELREKIAAIRDRMHDLTNDQTGADLQIDETEVTDLSPLAKLTKLEVLLMKRTRISDVSPLHDLTHLKHLYIEGSLVRDLTPVRSIPGLKVHEN